jgi:hypothetical protein
MKRGIRIGIPVCGGWMGARRVGRAAARTLNLISPGSIINIRR